MPAPFQNSIVGRGICPEAIGRHLLESRLLRGSWSVGQLHHHWLYRAYYNVKVVYGRLVFPVAVGIHEQKPLYAGFFGKDLDFQD